MKCDSIISQILFSKPKACGIAVASARAGNVIGGGDWALDRIIPDCVTALKSGEKIPVRNKVATRPWQHVLEPLSGYLLLAAELWRGLSEQKPLQAKFDYTQLCGAFNFGPELPLIDQSMPWSKKCSNHGLENGRTNPTPTPNTKHRYSTLPLIKRITCSTGSPAGTSKRPSRKP